MTDTTEALAEARAVAVQDARQEFWRAVGLYNTHNATAKCVNDKLDALIEAVTEAARAEERLAIAAQMNEEPNFKCWCGRAYGYHAEYWGPGWPAASMPLEWHPYEAEDAHDEPD